MAEGSKASVYVRGEGRERVIVMPWWRRTSPFIFVIIGGFMLGLLYAAWRPFTPKLAFPLYRFLIAGSGIFLGYFLLTQLLNRTRIFVRDGLVHARSGPLPWAGGTEIPVDRIVAVSHGTLWGVRAVFPDGEDAELVNYEYCDAEAVAPILADILGVPVVEKQWSVEAEEIDDT